MVIHQSIFSCLFIFLILIFCMIFILSHHLFIIVIITIAIILTLLLLLLLLLMNSWLPATVPLFIYQSMMFILILRIYNNPQQVPPPQIQQLQQGPQGPSFDGHPSTLSGNELGELNDILINLNGSKDYIT